MAAPPRRSAQIARLARAFPRQDVPGETFELYLADLAEVPVEMLEAAVTGLIRSSEWFPTLRAIREACAELVLGLPSEAAALAQIAARMEWGRRGASERPGEPPAVHAAVSEALALVGGYQAFRASEEPAVVRGQFSRLYREVRAAAVRDVQLAPALEPAKSTSRETGPPAPGNPLADSGNR